MLKRTICMLLSITLLMSTFGIMYIYAENDSEPTIQAVSPETVEEAAANASTETPEVINITSGSVLLEFGKTYQLVHDDWEVANIYSFSSIVSTISSNTISANEEGTTNLTVLYYTEDNVLSVFSCQVEILDISGTIDLAKSDVFVEKGKKYWLIHSEQTPTSISSMNHNIITFSNNFRVLVAVETGTTDLSYLYTEGSSSINAGCTVDVYETLDIDSYKTNTTDNFYIALSEYNNYDSFRYAITYTQEETQAYPTMQFPNYSNYITQEFNIVQQSDGYCYIYSPYNHAYLVVDDSEPTLNSEIIFTPTPSLLGEQIYKWKFLNDGESLLLIPKGGEDTQLFLSCQGALIRGRKYVFQEYSNTNKPQNWELYNSNVYINNYYDNSLYDEVGTDLMVIAAIPHANDFAHTVFSRYYPSMRVTMKLGPTYTPDSPADKCPTGVDNPCDNDICGSSHQHKNLMSRLSFTRDDLPRKNNEITVLWSDHSLETFCLHTAAGCTSSVALGWTASGYKNIRICLQILCIRKIMAERFGDATTYENIVSFASIVFAHEVTHALGAGDNYKRDSHIGENETKHEESLQCIMEEAIHPNRMTEFYQAVILGRAEPLCDDCYDDWSGNMNSSFFKGNYN